MILVLNCGSQSIKWKLFDEKLNPAKDGKTAVLNSADYQPLLDQELSKLKGYEITAVGHRVVHGGEIFKQPAEVSDESIKELERISYLAPLHNPYNILGIKAAKKIFPDVLQTAVFDTEFFSDLPEKSYTYALPEAVAREFNFRRYGFHGTSHEYVAKEAAKSIKKPFDKLKIITCHLGGGSSITAIQNGKPIDTSMGFTPMEGLVMTTRAGNIDAGIVLELASKLSPDKANEILNKESGLKGICGSGDMLEVLKRVESGDKKAELALDIFIYSIQKYIGSYFAILGGCDVLVFTGSIGSGNPKTRDMACEGLNILSKTKILAIETDEELAIARKIIHYEKQ